MYNQRYPSTEDLLCPFPTRSPTHDPDILPQALLRKYITYSKQNCKPMLQTADYDRITEVRGQTTRHMSGTHLSPGYGPPIKADSRVCPRDCPG